jgi:PAS domain S-box-containing protein
MIVSEKLIDLNTYVAFIGHDRLVKWSLFQYRNAEQSYQENPDENICCKLIGKTNGGCDQCPANNAFLNHTSGEIELTGENGRNWLVSAYPAYDSNGRFSGIFQTVKDTTASNNSIVKLASDSLLESERRISTLLSNLPGLAYRCKNDKDWTMEFVSQGCFDIIGYHPDDLINNKKLSFNSLIAPEFQDVVWKQWQKAIAAKRTYTGEYQVISSDGNRKWVWEQGQAIHNTQGEVIALEGFIQDITKRKLTEIALSNSEVKYRNLVENALVGVYSTYTNGEIIIVNDALSRMLEYNSPEDFHSVQNVMKVYANPGDRDVMIERMRPDGKLTDYELIWLTKTGKEITVLISAIINGDIISGMVMDITHRKLMEQKLLEQKEKAEQSDKLKTAFLANISHEIRTPLNGIIGFADILIQQEISESDKEQYSNLIHNLSGQLLSIVNDILEISRIETNQVKLSIAPVNINHILLKLYASFENQARDKHLVFELDSELTENQDVIYGDSTRLVQILTHLLNNAFKFTYSGSIQLGCRLNGEKLIFSVKDTGIGILPENKEIIFERFRQVEDTLTRKFGGSGLGLSISKALVEMMGGEISVDCDSAKGSTFYFTIPYMNVPLKNKVQRNYIETKSCLRDTRILICEDDDFGYLYVNRLLTQAGATTFRAISGTRAIKFCQSEEVIDLIIMDLRMPEMSGNDAAGFIKKLRPSIPIIVSTASSSYEIESLLDKRLFDGVVYKPIISANLLETVCSLL